MCTATNSAIQAAQVREEKQTLLTKPRRVDLIGLVLGWLAGKPDYLQKLKVPEGYEKINENRNI